MKKRHTKKEFREKLNDLYRELGNHKNGRYQQRTRPYGDYLYHQDRAKFDVMYSDWLVDLYATERSSLEAQ